MATSIWQDNEEIKPLRRVKRLFRSSFTNAKKEDNKIIDYKCGVVLTDLKVLGAMWDNNKKTLKT